MSRNNEIFIRADANHSIGMGHIMRCLSIADAFTMVNETKISFVLADDNAYQLICGRGYSAVVLNTDYTNMESELCRWPETEPELIVVDSYYVTKAYLQKLRNRTEKLIYIDDLASFAYPVDILINYNIYAPYINYHDIYISNKLSEPFLILGARYAPLRRMFRNIQKKQQPETVHNILFSTGGADELHLNLALIHHLLKTGTKGRCFHFLLGAMNTDKELFRSISKGNEDIVLHDNVIDMENLISSCDLVVSAAGSTLYEVCACGIPMIVYSIANNQKKGMEAFEKLGLAINVGDLRTKESLSLSLEMKGKLDEDAVERVFGAIDKLSDEYNYRVKIGIQMQNLIDGFGADRIVKAIRDF